MTKEGRIRNLLLQTGKRSLLASLGAILCSTTLLLSFADSADAEPQRNDDKGLAIHGQAFGAAAEPAASIAPSLPEYLKTIEIPEAWALLDQDVTSMIAIVDTGVDYQHPELKPYLMTGKNLVNERRSAQDDNGHGTAVAGIIVAVAKAGESSPAEGRWKGKLLPIKALDENGEGNEDKLTQGIRYAVNQGADIIVLSLGLRRDAPGLREAVAYAESQGVLLVAASGNDAAVFGKTAAVQYPAAYPTVLSVAGMDGKRTVASSTAGPENDISAAWKVRTLEAGGEGIEMVGTSMAAPQAAAVAAMLKAAYPNWKPLQIREALRRTAQPSGSKRWNANTGYGLLSAAKALQVNERINWREPNDTKEKASEFPVGKEVVGDWSGTNTIDWYAFDAKYDGVFSLSGDKARFELYGAEGRIEPRPSTGNPEGILMRWPVKKGRNWLQVRKPEQAASSTSSSYRLVSSFTMNPDAREPNDTAASASTLPARSQQWTGNFHRRGDVDWFVVNLPKAGILKLSVTPDTTRIDPEIRIQPAGGTEIIVDERGDGGSEYWTWNNARAGKYYIRISNAVSSNPEAVIGTYAASLEYITVKEDFYEPNDSPLTSTPLTFDKVYNSLIQTSKDQDWYRFTLTRKTTVRLTVGHIPQQMQLNAELRNKKLQTLEKWTNGDGQKTLLGESVLEAGTYYVKVTADSYNRNQYYGLKLQAVQD
jgi:hypothetical protein